MIKHLVIVHQKALKLIIIQYRQCICTNKRANNTPISAINELTKEQEVKRILTFLGIIVVLASCSKRGTVAPAVISSKPDSATILHTVAVSAPTQRTLTTLTDSTLILAFKEDVTLLLPAAGFNQSFSVHLSQDFSASALSKFNYSITTNDGITYYDWVDDNLNNVDQKTVSDTTVNGLEMTKIHVVRTFNFVQQYANEQLALTAQNTILHTNNDKVIVSSYVLFDKAYPTATLIVPIKYVN